MRHGIMSKHPNRSAKTLHQLALSSHLPPSLSSLKTRWFARQWRRSAGSSLDSVASTSLWEEELEREEEGEVEGRQPEEPRPSRSLRFPPPLCLELHPPPLLPAPPAGGRPLEAATSAGMWCRQLTGYLQEILD